MNPTTDVFEQRITALEGGVGALGVASGQAANIYSILNIARAGDHIVSSASLYGGTYSAFVHTVPKLGITVTLVDPSDLGELRTRDQTEHESDFRRNDRQPAHRRARLRADRRRRASQRDPADRRQHAGHAVPVRPFEWGADIVTHSATKFIGGHGTSIGGIIVDSGKFDWAASGKFPDLVEPDPSYHGVSYTAAVGPLAYIIKARVQLLRDIGAALSPFNSWLFVQGLETLSLRMERHSQNALRGGQASARSRRRCVGVVPRTGRRPRARSCRQYLPKGAGAILTFGIKGGVDAAKTSSTRSRSSRCSPTSATRSRSSSIRPRRPTSSSPRPSRSTAALPRTWCASRSRRRRSDRRHRSGDGESARAGGGALTN